jgi:hypothetical protein
MKKVDVINKIIEKASKQYADAVDREIYNALTFEEPIAFTVTQIDDTNFNIKLSTKGMFHWCACDEINQFREEMELNIKEQYGN